MAAINYDDISSGATAAENNSPSSKLRRPSWNQIVRGGESEQQQHMIPLGDSQSHSAAAVAVSASGMEVNGPGSSLEASGGEDGGAENGGGGGGGGAGANGNVGKRVAWKKPAADGTVHVVEAVGGVVMGAESWPALSGSTRPGKALSSGTSKGLVDGSPLGQGSGPPSVSQKQADDTVVANSNSGYSSPSRLSLRSTKRGGPSSSSNGILAMEPPASPGSPADSRASNPSPRDSNARSGVSSNSHGGNELLQQQRNSFRNRNGGTHSHGDGHHRQNFGSRRDQERGNQDWNHRNVNSSRDNHAPQQRGRYGRSTPPPPPPLPGPAPFITSVPVRAYGGPIAFPELQSPYYIYPLQSPTFYPSVPPQLIYQPPHDNTVHARILSQIDYYFSNENLVKDTFLRRNMDEQGWVPISMIARFNKISQLTDNIQIILDTLHHSIVVEVQGDKIRKRNDWRRWIMPAANPYPDTANTRSPEILNPDRVATGVQSLSLDGRETHPGAAASQPHVRAESLRRMPMGDLSIPGETGQPSVADSYPTVAAVGTGQ